MRRRPVDCQTEESRHFLQQLRGQNSPTVQQGYQCVSAKPILHHSLPEVPDERGGGYQGGAEDKVEDEHDHGGEVEERARFRVPVQRG